MVGSRDLNTGQQRVWQTLQRVRGDGVVFGPPKSRRSRRVLTMPAVVVQALKRHRNAQGQERKLADGQRQETGLVFTTATGRHRDLRVTEDVDDHPGRHASGQEKSGAGVPQVMKPDRPHTGSRDQPAEGGVQVAWFDVNHEHLRARHAGDAAGGGRPHGCGPH
ncbi:hypothetical protein GCM10027259_07490 [Micromonospora palomenae]